MPLDDIKAGGHKPRRSQAMAQNTMNGLRAPAKTCCQTGNRRNGTLPRNLGPYLPHRMSNPNPPCYMPPNIAIGMQNENWFAGQISDNNFCTCCGRGAEERVPFICSGIPPTPCYYYHVIAPCYHFSHCCGQPCGATAQIRTQVTRPQRQSSSTVSSGRFHNVSRMDREIEGQVFRDALLASVIVNNPTDNFEKALKERNIRTSEKRKLSSKGSDTREKIVKRPREVLPKTSPHETYKSYCLKETDVAFDRRLKSTLAKMKKRRRKLSSPFITTSVSVTYGSDDRSTKTGSAAIADVDRKLRRKKFRGESASQVSRSDWNSEIEKRAANDLALSSMFVNDTNAAFEKAVDECTKAEQKLCGTTRQQTSALDEEIEDKAMADMELASYYINDPRVGFQTAINEARSKATTSIKQPPLKKEGKSDQTDI